MAKLTPKQEKFCKAIADGLSQSDAYRHAYDCVNSKPETVRSKAYNMMQRDDIRTTIQKLKNKLVEKELWSREDSVRALIEVVQKDFEAKPADKIRAIAELNKMHGWQSSTVDLKNTDGSLTPKTINHFYGQQESDS